jgi:hypothetical protein
MNLGGVTSEPIREGPPEIPETGRLDMGGAGSRE